jgi:hypothetical protein
MAAQKQQGSAVVGYISLASAWGKRVMRWQILRRLVKYIPALMRSEPILLKGQDARDVFFNTLDDEDFGHYFGFMRSEPSNEVLRMLRRKCSLQKLPLQCLVFGGTADRIAPNQKKVAEGLGVELDEVPCCHMMPVDPNYMSVVGRINDWLKEKFTFAYLQ